MYSYLNNTNGLQQFIGELDTLVSVSLCQCTGLAELFTENKIEWQNNDHNTDRYECIGTNLKPY